MNTDHFAKKASQYERDTDRVSNVQNIADSITSNVELDPHMHLMDFGSGTGLLLERIAPLVRKITAVDVSSAMNAQLHAKKSHLPCEVDILEVDLASEEIAGSFDGIISSMTMHHIEDIRAMLSKFHDLLADGGFIAISDLDAEDGSFHTEDTGVFHFGFDRDEFSEMARLAGFSEVKVSDASVVKKPHGEYGVFLLTARKQVS